MELKQYYFSRTLEDSHSGYGITATSTEKCPIGKVEKIGFACTKQPCCKGHARFMSIVVDENSWIMCEETTKILNEKMSKA